jgi:integrase
MGYSKDQITGHGFRHTASTMLNEEQKWSIDAIERQLSHKDNSIRGTYNNAKYLDERRRMIQSWANTLDSLKVSKES